MKNVAAREHDRGADNGSMGLDTIRRDEIRSDPEARAVPVRLPPNPLWVITIGMGAFFAVVAALFAAG